MLDNYIGWEKGVNKCCFFQIAKIMWSVLNIQSHLVITDGWNKTVAVNVLSVKVSSFAFFIRMRNLTEIILYKLYSDNLEKQDW
jgi:hypothetical protein